MSKILLIVRGLFLTIYLPLHTLVCSVIVVTLLIFRASRQTVDVVVGKWWCQTMVSISGVKPVVKGVENVPTEKGCLFLFLHASHLDIPILFVTSPKSMRFGAKSSLFKIPLFGAAMRMAGTLEIARENRSKVMRVYKEAEARVAKGEAFALAPEGTRRLTDTIGPFKSGPFFFAINAKMPIVPVVICGLSRVLGKNDILVNKRQWRKEVAVSFLPAVETKDIPLADMKAMKAQIHADMVAEFESLKPIYLS